MPNPFDAIIPDRMTNISRHHWPLLFSREDRHMASWNREQAIRDVTSEYDENERLWDEAWARCGGWQARWDGLPNIPWVTRTDKNGYCEAYNVVPVDPALSAFADYTEA